MALMDKFSYSSPASAPDKRILQHLNHLLNTRREEGSTLPSFGLSDYRDAQLTRNFLQALLDEMTETIQRYEPRLQQINVHPETHGRFCFEIDATFDQQPYRFRCVPDPTATRQLSMIRVV